MAEQIRNKYNTLTPAEAKKLNRYLAQRTPVRTASVLNKPRAPPIVVTNLDDDHDEADQTITNNNNNNNQLDETALNDHQRRQPSLNLYQLHDSLSSLSFRSSRDTPDCATIQRNLQTMSVDLTGRNDYHNYRLPSAYDPARYNQRLRSLPRRSNTLNTRISDDSFSSAKSDFFNLSGRSASVTPTKFTRVPNSLSATPEPIRSASRPSLSSSTYKVLQSPLANFKRLFRGIQRPFSQSSTSSNRRVNPTRNHQNQAASTRTTAGQRQESSLADLSLSDSISCLSLNKSQSPTVLPPPPSELKSLGYLESGCIDYSNYDDFTKARNERLFRQTANSGPNSRPNESGAGDKQLSFGKSDDSDDSSWQMTSLPVYFERNLTTVFEEKQQPPSSIVYTMEQAGKLEARQRRRLTQIVSPRDLDSDSVSNGGERIYQSIKPPRRFDDPTSLLVVDPSLESERRQPASPFRFSFGQPLSCAADQASVNTNLGLPPRLPTGQQQQQQQQSSQQQQLMSTKLSSNKMNSEIQARHHDNSSSGNSSNCSSQMNVINYCDRQTVLSSSIAAGKTLQSTNSAYSLEAHELYGGNHDDLIGDANSTLQSDSSTIRGESNLAAFYASKFAEFERTVASLKNKLIVKEKELTELQLVQLNSDYTIERLKERLVKLERENQQLRSVAANSNNSSNGAGSNNNTNRDIVF